MHISGSDFYIDTGPSKPKQKQRPLREPICKRMRYFSEFGVLSDFPYKFKGIFFLFFRILLVFFFPGRELSEYTIKNASSSSKHTIFASPPANQLCFGLVPKRASTLRVLRTQATGTLVQAEGGEVGSLDGPAIRNANHGDSRESIRRKIPIFATFEAIRANRFKPAIRNFFFFWPPPPPKRNS